MGALEVSRRSQGAPGHQKAPGSPLEAPRRPQGAPESPRKFPEGPRKPQEAPRRLQEAPGALQKAPGGPQEAPGSPMFQQKDMKIMCLWFSSPMHVTACKTHLKIIIFIPHARRFLEGPPKLHKTRGFRVSRAKNLIKNKRKTLFFIGFKRAVFLGCSNQRAL